MPGLAKHDLDALRLKIAALEKRPLLAEGAAMLAQRLGKAANDGPGIADPLELLAAPGGLLHEVFADEQRQTGAALGFSFGLARQLLTAGRQAILYLQLAGETQELGLPFVPADIALTAGAFAAISVAFHLLLDPGDEAIFSEPAWFCYEDSGYKLGMCEHVAPYSGIGYNKLGLIANGTDSPNTAKLFLRYMLTEEGIAPQVEDGKFSSNNDVEPAADEPSGIADIWDEVHQPNKDTQVSDFERLPDWSDFWIASNHG